MVRVFPKSANQPNQMALTICSLISCFGSTVPETVGVEVVLKNPLKIPLNLTNLLLLWEFTPEDNTASISNEVSSE